MSIEIRQLLVKSNVVQRTETEEIDNAQNSEEFRVAILDECKKLIFETLQEIKER